MIFGPDNRPIQQLKKGSIPLFVVAINLETGNTEIFTSREIIDRIPLGVRQAIVDGIKRTAEKDFRCTMTGTGLV